MSAPYWGQLPGPKVAHGHGTHSGHARRRSESDDYASNADRRSSLDVPHNRRSNRASAQTQATEAPSESTFSPYDSPTAASFNPQGLAPRPGSYQRAAPSDQTGHPSDGKRNLDSSRQDDDFDQQLSPVLPAAPEVPRGPPLSYRHPYGNGGLPYTHTASDPPPEHFAPDDSQAQNDEMDEEGGYFPSSSAQTSHRNASGPAPVEGARRDSSASAYEQLSRRATTGGSSGGRKKFADDRSPLQRLELTLDSITKEEKRARVEAAERRARERAALKAGKQPAGQQPRTHERKPSVSRGERRTSTTAAPIPVAHSSTHRDAPIEASREAPIDAPRNVPRQEHRDDHDELPADAGASRDIQTAAPRLKEVPRNVPRVMPTDYHQHEPREISRDAYRDSDQDFPQAAYKQSTHQAPVHRSTSSRHHEPLLQHDPEDPYYYESGALLEPQEPTSRQRHPESQSGVPKRNLSFRERAAREQVQPVHRDEPQPVQPPASGGGFSLTRSGSNKLRKEPPADAKYPQRANTTKKAAPVARRQQPAEYNDYDEYDQPVSTRNSRNKELPPDPPEARKRSIDAGAGRQYAMMPGEGQGIRRRVTDPIPRAEYGSEEEYIPEPTRGKIAQRTQPEDMTRGQGAAASRRKVEREDSYSSDDSHHHRFSNLVFKRREDMVPGDGLYKPPQWLDEWKKATVGTLGGNLLDLKDESFSTQPDPSKTWWEQEGRSRSNSYSGRRKAEAFDGEYSENTPTRFKPPLFLKCGPLLRYCGIRREKSTAARSTTLKGSAGVDKETWRGSIMIVTQDSESSYDIAPTLRLFAQGIELLPPPPHRVKGDLSPEYVDPIAGHPKLGRRGETLYVRPVEHLEEGRDLSRDETDSGLFEKTRSPPDTLPSDGSKELPGSFASRRKRVGVDGEKVQKYKDVRGFRLHAERGCTFWRFNIEVELREKQQRIAYRINRGPAMAFWVPGIGQTMNMMFHSCNGFSLSVNPNDLSGPDPLWRDVLNNHQTQPFHLMIGGGDQIYNDCVADQTVLFKEWIDVRNPVHKHTVAFTPEMQDELETFYLERYCMWFSQGLFSLASSQIPMVNMYDDHDVFDGYGSYPHHDMKSPVMSGLGAVAFKYYMLFQHQSIMDETEKSEPSWILGAEPGPYINELSHSLFVSVGAKAALLAVDCRTERTEHDVVSDQTWERVMNRMYAELRRGQVEHLLVLLGVPIAYPRLVWLENILTSRLMGPVKALGRAGMFGKALNNIDGGVEVLDDLNDHWTAKNHKQERSIVVEDLQDLAIDKSVRVTILSGDVHLAAVGQFYSNPKLGLAKHKDPRYMPNVISSAIVNTPPPDMLADVLNKRNKVHHFDKQTDEDMIPMFSQGVDGKPRNNKHLLPHRNWCSIREWAPGQTPPPTPPRSLHERSPSPPPKREGGGGVGGLMRRLSLSKSRPAEGSLEPRESVRGSRPPITRGTSGGGGLFRSLSRRNSTNSERPPPAKLTRSMSVGSERAPKKGGFFNFGRRPSQSRRDDRDAYDEDYRDDYDDEEYWDEPAPQRHRASGLRGGAAYDEYTEGDDSYYMAQPPRRAQTVGSRAMSHSRTNVAQIRSNEPEAPPTRPFHRTPTGLSTKQKKNAKSYEVDLEGGLDICLNVEVNPKDPAGITVPYRLLVPKLIYDYNAEEDQALEEAEATPAPAPAPAEPSGFKRLLSLRKKPKKTREPPVEDDYSDEEEYYDDERDYHHRR